MRLFITLLALGFAAAAAVPVKTQRIVGGSVTTIQEYPSIVALLYSSNWNQYYQSCGGIILNNRNVLTAAHCPYGDATGSWRIRVGSTYANSGGVVHNVDAFVIHGSYNRWTYDNDIAIMRTANTIEFNSAAQPGSFAGSHYHLGDNQVVWAAGWGTTSSGGPASETLRHVQVWTVNQDTCRNRYTVLGRNVTTNMLCSGWLDIGGRDQCQGDSGGPLYHNGIVVGVTSWGQECALSYFPGVNARVSRYADWIRTNTL